ncbi:hypothetical protein GUJ93_ZPchr0540g6452 [Zizania palustris]|uniref:Uncharacterized protein n=1 Tax=Zizania palustris TaxID=103762 RepID=A0A8J5V0K1_ZIZPA|nr:hypothetical protein GUJ93_ZPchr0540g6452 [Zizania palustris]
MGSGDEVRPEAVPPRGRILSPEPSPPNQNPERWSPDSKDRSKGGLKMAPSWPSERGVRSSLQRGSISRVQGASPAVRYSPRG